MKYFSLTSIPFFFILFLLGGCAIQSLKPLPIDTRTVEPGSSITRGGTPMKLLGKPIKVGDKLPEVMLVNANLKEVDLSKQAGEVLLISIVPSIDTGVCERQTHYLGEAGAKLSSGIRRITISRDLPFAQKRFAEEAELNNILYLSDYRTAEFGKSTGLLIEKINLLSRAVMVTDRQGIVRYLQVVPEIGHLPDLDRAFLEAEKLLAE